MREILFRGKRKDNGEWTYGDLEHNGKGEMKWVNGDEIIPETVGQYTGLTDKNGKMIFESDIIKAYLAPKIFANSSYAIGNVIFEKGTFKVSVRISKNSKVHKLFEEENATAYSIEHNFLDRHYVLEVIGNVYNNPELLGE